MDDVEIKIAVSVWVAAYDRAGGDDADRLELLEDEIDGVSDGCGEWFGKRGPCTA
jgi:hypothetical protein